MWNLTRDEQLVLFFILAAFLIGLGIKLWGGIPHSPDVSFPNLIRIKVSGAVKKPGWYSIPQKAYVKEAIEKAGGCFPWADLTKINLNFPVKEGREVNVPEGKINLNQASPTDLAFLPGIGPVLAKRIVEHREKVGGFKNISQLKDVPGIGKVRFERIKNRITLEGENKL